MTERARVVIRSTSAGRAEAIAVLASETHSPAGLVADAEKALQSAASRAGGRVCRDVAELFLFEPTDPDLAVKVVVDSLSAEGYTVDVARRILTAPFT